MKNILGLFLFFFLLLGLPLNAAIAPFHQDLNKETINNDSYHKVAYTIPGQMQLVLMSLQPQEDVGMKYYPRVAQFIRVEKGSGEAIVDGKKLSIAEGFSVVIPAGTHYNIKNTSTTDKMKLYSMFTPPQYSPGTIQQNKPLIEETKRSHKAK